MSQQLNRLEGLLKSTSDLAMTVELTARVVIILARLGRFEEARFKVRALRENYGDWRSGRIHVWIMLSEAIADWYADLSSQALDRVTRVQVLSSAMQYAEMHAISSAWKAHIQFEISDFDGMLHSIDLAFRSSAGENAEANARLAIVLCNASALCGDWASAQSWFAKGRDFSLAEGDQASVEALQHNRAVLTLTCARAEACISPIEAERIKTVRREMDSSRNLQLLTRISALANHRHLAEARLLILEGRFEDAVVALASVRNEAPFASYHFSQFEIDLEIAYCKFRLNLVEDALSLFLKIDIRSIADLDVDDQLSASNMCLEMARLDPRFGDPTEISLRKEELALAYAKAKIDLAAGLRRLRDDHELV